MVQKWPNQLARHMFLYMWKKKFVPKFRKTNTNLIENYRKRFSVFSFAPKTFQDLISHIFTLFKTINILYIRHISNNLVHHQREKLWCVLEKAKTVMKSMSRGFDFRSGLSEHLIFASICSVIFSLRHIRVSLSDDEPINILYHTLLNLVTYTLYTRHCQVQRSGGSRK